jgi:outer membrane protein
MGSVAVAQPSKLTATAFSGQTGLPTVSDSLDYAQFAGNLPENLPTVPDSALFPLFVQSVPDLPVLPPTSVDATSRAGTPSQTVALTQPWWIEPKPINGEVGEYRNIELDNLIWLAVENSPHIRSLLLEPQIEEARASATLGVFDPTPFINSIFNDSSNPVGNTLTTGGPTRLNENLWENGAGVKAKTMTGAQTELVQEMSFHDSNSLFFKPNQQSDTRIVMRYTQPLMRGAGAAYNRSSFVIANLSTSENAFDVTLKIQQHAFTITTNYWELYVARAYHEQSEQGLERLTALRDQLAGRADLDSLKSQLFRADAQISRQRSQEARAKTQVTASEAKLRAAVGGSELTAGVLIPITSPADFKINLDVQSELGLALNFHPNIQATQARLKAAKVRLKVAENELRPTLNLVMEGYARGLNGNYNFGSSLGDQFSQGAPSYSGGLTYQRPYNNVAAKAIMREKRLELQKILFDLDNALLIVGAEVESEIAAAEAAYTELEAAVRSTLAAHAELEYLTARWGNAFLDASQGGTSLLLDQLLNANVQLIQAENAWARAQADHMLALARVRLASGSLLTVNTAITSSIQR